MVTYLHTKYYTFAFLVHFYLILTAHVTGQSIICLAVVSKSLFDTCTLVGYAPVETHMVKFEDLIYLCDR